MAETDLASDTDVWCFGRSLIVMNCGCVGLYCVRPYTFDLVRLLGTIAIDYECHWHCQSHTQGRKLLT